MWERRRTLGNPDQHRARGWAAVGVPADSEARRRQQHNRDRRWHSRAISEASARCAESLVAKVVFDQSVFVKTAIENLGNEGGIGLVLTALMILIFLGQHAGHDRGVAFDSTFRSGGISWPSTRAAGSINTMVLGGLALAFSRLIDNSVVVLENIFRHLEMGETPEVAAEKGGQEVAMPVSGSDVHDRHRVFSGGLSLRRQPLLVYRAGGCGRASRCSRPMWWR